MNLGRFFSIVFILTVGSVQNAQAQLRVFHPCDPEETWESTPKYPWQNEFQKYLKVNEGHSHALVRATQIKGEYSTYLKARVLLNLRQYFLSSYYFNDLLKKSSDPEMKLAAVVCLTKLQKRMPTIELPKSEVWQDLLIDDPATLFSLILNELPRESPRVALLKPPYSLFIKALYAHSKNNPASEGRLLREFLGTSGQNPFLRRYHETAHLLLARALYANGQHQAAVKEYQLVEGTSNAQVDVLNESGWPLLKLDQPAKVLGLLQQLKTGAMKSVFAPEPYLSSAQATLKLCWYPETQEMIQAFKTQYRPVFQWLNQHQSNESFYPLAVNALKGQSDVPAKISLEWIRSPSFMTRQQDLNLLVKQEAALHNWSQSRNEATTIYRELERLAKREFVVFRTQVVHEINQDLQLKNRVLLGTLTQTRKALEQVENQVMIKATAGVAGLEVKSPTKSKGASKPAASETTSDGDDWHWGRFTASETGDAELWEDEVGTTFQLKIEDRCKSEVRPLKPTIKKNN